LLQITQHLSHISQLHNFVRPTIYPSAGRQGGVHQQGEKLMRTFASAFLSAIAAVSISGALFSVVLI